MKKSFMKLIENPSLDSWESLTSRPSIDRLELDSAVSAIMELVLTDGDLALKKFTKDFDGIDLQSIEVSQVELSSAESSLSEELKNAISLAKDNIWKFHSAQVREPLEVETMPGVRCSRRAVPIDSVGLYIPGGTAPLFSTVLMLGIPAMIAGCKEVVLCSPPNASSSIHPAVLYAANLLGIKQVFKVGGAQAIAAMAFGTETVPKVCKIFGPGNQYVDRAKQIVQTRGVAIDLPAGPSEVAVIADNSAKASFVAADLLSQAEHGPDSQVLLLSDSKEFVAKVLTQIELQLEELPRSELALKALEKSSAIVLDSVESCMEFSNLYAPEHLIIATEEAEDLAGSVRNAGSVFIGHWTPESVGDYASGTNHTLPTAGSARAWSGVSLDSYFKFITFQSLSEQGLSNLGPVVETMARAEELTAHERAVTLRLRSLKENLS